MATPIRTQQELLDLQTYRLAQQFAGRYIVDDVSKIQGHDLMGGVTTGAIGASMPFLGAQNVYRNLTTPTGPGYHYQVTQNSPNLNVDLNALTKKPAFDIKQKTKEKKSMFGYTKEYFEKHKETVMTISVVLLIDHFFLHGALRERIRSLLEGVLSSMETRLGLPHKEETIEVKAKKHAA